MTPTTKKTSKTPSKITKDSTPYDLHNALVYVVRENKMSFVVMGKILRELKKKDTFKNAIGKGIDTWADYLKQPEIGLAPQEANRLIQIYEEFILRLGYDEETISAVPVKNMHYLLPLVKKLNSKDETDELVADATLLPQKDFKERIYDRKVEADGNVTRTYEYMIMQKTLETNTLKRVPGIESDTIRITFSLE